jgi:hypothetical protein
MKRASQATPTTRCAPRAPLSLACAATMLAVLVATCTGAHAAVYKCANGKAPVVYQDAPCREGQEISNFERDPPTFSVVPFARPNSPREGARMQGRVPAREPVRAEKKRRERAGDAAERKHLATGMAEAEVLRRIGRPDVTSGGRGKEGRRWIYLPVDGDAQTITTVTFKAGAVADVDRKVVY